MPVQLRDRAQGEKRLRTVPRRVRRPRRGVMRERREEPLILVVHPHYRCRAYPRTSLRLDTFIVLCCGRAPLGSSTHHQKRRRVVFNLRRLDLNLLTVFEAIYELGSVTAAADRLG